MAVSQVYDYGYYPEIRPYIAPDTITDYLERVKKWGKVELRGPEWMVGYNYLKVGYC